MRAFEIAKFSKEKRIQYNKDMYDERRRNGEMKAARQDGLAEGLAEGLARGREEGRNQTIRQFLESGMSMDLIAKALNLTEEERLMFQ